MIQVTDTIAIDPREIDFTFVRASGPGGQNVNKVSSAVQLRFDASASASLPEDVKRRLIALAGRRATSAGVIVIEAKRYRHQEQNREDALQRLTSLIAKAAQPSKPRRSSHPPTSSIRERLDIRKRRSRVKKLRQRPVSDS